jgi:2-keto-4-pentenoate hydratase
MPKVNVVNIDRRVQRGMERQLELRRARLDAGERSIGWKVGFGSQAAMKSLGVTSPLVGFLTEAAALPSGSEVSIAGWAKPALEPEIAIHIGKGLGGRENRETLKAAVEAIGPAIELADVEPPPADVEAILAGNIFNRYVILGKADASRAGCVLDGLTAHVVRDGQELATTSELLALTGDLIEIVGHVASLLAQLGEALRAGEVIIAGSIIPPVWVETGGVFRYELEPIDSLTVHLSA